MLLYLCAVSVLFCPVAWGIGRSFQSRLDISVHDVFDSRVIITPYVEADKIEEVRNLTLVRKLHDGVYSYSGFVTVDKHCNSNMFFWFFPAQLSAKDLPVTVWLQGGPGASSLYGQFMENGPIQLISKNKLVDRIYDWTYSTSMLYIDNPVGTGFSYTDGCYVKTEEEVGKNLLIAVKQIMKMFPEYGENSFFVTGESYAGKYVPAFAHAIHKDKSSKDSLNLQGIAIGNGLVDPCNQLHYSDYLYQLGLLDETERQCFKEMEDKCKDLIAKEKWKEAFYCFDSLLNGDQISHPTYFRNVTGYTYYFNYLYSSPKPEPDVAAFVTQTAVRNKLHVGNATWHSGKEVEVHLMEDVMKSTRPLIEELLEHYKVLIYNGQLDIIVAYPLTEGYLKKLNWSEAEEYKKAKRHKWKVGNDLAGYVKTAGKLTEILVRNAGHMVPADQPKWAFDMITRFLEGKPFY